MRGVRVVIYTSGGVMCLASVLSCRTSEHDVVYILAMKSRMMSSKYEEFQLVAL